MSLTLVLTRHAKSSWSDPGLDDFERPLNSRGRKSAPVIGVWLAQTGHVPLDVVVSGARRTVDTWAGIAPALPYVAKMRSNPALYHASAETILGVLRAAGEPVTMLIGHNPGLAEFARRIVAEPGTHPRYADYPTGATAVIQFEGQNWREVDWGKGKLLDFLVPREFLE